MQGPIIYAYTAIEVDYHCTQLLKQGPQAVGFDIEWRVTYKPGEVRKTALMQLCSKTLEGQYKCMLLHIAHTGLTPSLIKVLHRQVSSLESVCNFASLQHVPCKDAWINQLKEGPRCCHSSSNAMFSNTAACSQQMQTENILCSSVCGHILHSNTSAEQQCQFTLHIRNLSQYAASSCWRGVSETAGHTEARCRHQWRCSQAAEGLWCAVQWFGLLV